MRILLVDDDLDFSALFVDSLNDLGYFDVTTAISGPQALSFVERATHDFECVIIDIRMPEMSGIELCRQLRADAAYADVPIIMNTVMSDKGSIDEAFAAGATDYLTKPIDPLEIKSRLGMVQLLLDERHRAETDPKAVSPLRLQSPSYGFFDSIPMKEIDGGIGILAMENYLNALGFFRALRVAVVGIHVDNARDIYDMEGSSAFGDVMLDIATCISDSLSFPEKMIAYKGAGEFVCILPNNNEENLTNFSDQLLSYMAEFQDTYEKLSICKPVISIGPAVTCSASNITAPSRLIDEAIQSSKHHNQSAVNYA
ncbi:response regulator [Marivita geojedonensis]|uniref:response regulator n=1 Tax=Marivita geojedonensis TaxID=1123756 RepID=UPI000A1E4B1C|nr:response regulator [Marivita geojedonensis]PRY74196.1 diguanylate cyclase with GGDEF domain [Marivita geojedonensis]